MLEPVHSPLFRHTDKIANPLRVLLDIARTHQHIVPFDGRAKQTISPVLEASVQGIFQDESLLAHKVITDHPAGKHKGQPGPLIPLFPEVIDVGILWEAATSA